MTKLKVTSTDKSIKTEVGPGPSDKTFKITVTPTESGRPDQRGLESRARFSKRTAKNVLRERARRPPGQAGGGQVDGNHAGANRIGIGHASGELARGPLAR